MNQNFIQKNRQEILGVRNILITIFTIAGIIGIALPKNQVMAHIDPAVQAAGLQAVMGGAEWSQEGHDAQRTGYTSEEPQEPWTLAWTWNGPDATGGTGGHIYDAPKDAHTVTGGSNIYVPAGPSGLYALRKSDGAQAWHLASPAFNATPAYDSATGALFAGGSDGILYKLDGATGSVLGTFNAGGALNKAVLLVGSSVYVQTDSGVLHKVNTGTMTPIWSYAAGSNTATPAAYSANTGLVVFCTADLYVHAVRESDGVGQWRVKPTSLPAQAPYSFEGFWPVIAEQHGIVFVRLNLGADALWSGPGTGTGGGGVYPMTNADTRTLLESNNGALENLFALDLKDGSKKFIPAVGYGAVEYRADPNSSLTLVAPPVPVIKVNPDGSEVAYISFRSGQGNVVDGRWDSHMGEMVLDDTTIPGLAAGDLRFVDFPNSYVFITDEQTPFSMAGDTIFQAHWGASESMKILDRSASLGLSATAPITAQARPVVIRRQQSCGNFNPQTHYTACGLTLVNDGRYWNGPGFWTYWNVVDPPPFSGGAYSLGNLPRYTYVSDGAMYVEGNGGDLMAFRYNGSAPAPTPTAVSPSPTPTPTRLPATPTQTYTSQPSPTNTVTSLPPTVTKTATPLPPTATATATPVQLTATKPPLPAATATPTLRSHSNNGHKATKTPPPTATETPLPTSTQSILPTVTQTSLPTATPAPSATATRTPQPTATQTAIPTATRTPISPTAAPTQVVPTATTLPGSGRISNVNILTRNPAVFEAFEVQFNVQTLATNLDMPYDANPPAGVDAGIGVTVNAEFSTDNWQTRQVQPAFLYQPYTHTVVDGKDHFTPAGAQVWDVRYAPQKLGAYQFRLSVQDSQGTSYYPDLSQPALSFNVGSVSSNSNAAKGFLSVSPTDSRYFQFQDGSPFVGVGFNDGFDSSTSVDQKMADYQANRMNFMRVWMSGSAMNGSQWSSWASNFTSQDGYLPGTSFDIDNTYNGSAVSMRLDDANPCLYADFWQGGVPVEPNTQYRVTARIKVSGVSGPSASGDYGFVIKQGDWLGTDCVKPATGQRITAPVNGSTGWITVTGTYTTGVSQSWLGNLYLARENATGGQVYVDAVHLYRANDPNQTELLRQPYADATEHFSSMGAALWDLYIQDAQSHGVYLKLVIDEKNEWIRNHMGADGKMSASGSNDNFYAAPNTRVRWLEQAWWRYIIARWGYSTAIHSFEYINEGDPYNTNLYEAADAMAQYFHQNDPSHHMVTTSFWSSFPNKEFWSNSQYSDLDYTDLHAYISTGWGINTSFLPANMLETRPEYVHSGNGSAMVDGATQSSTSIVPRGLVLQGAGEWVIQYWIKTSNLTANCPYSGSGSMMRLRWNLDGGPYNGGKSGVVPANSEAKDYICTSPGGTLDWTQFSSTRDRNGASLPASARLVLTDNNPHELNLLLENSYGTGGTAWFDDIQVINPAGQVSQVIGEFDTTPLDEDTAWYNQAYGEVFGAKSIFGANKPLVRGETGIDFVGNQTWNPDLLKDTQGIWLHNNVWGQINAGGMYDLFWWATETIPPSIYSNFLTYQNFMQDVPLNNGHYQELQAQTSNSQLRALGQRDDVDGRMHLWVQNIQHTWKRVVNGPAVPSVTGTITIPDVAPGSYRVEWWDPYATSNPIFLTQTVMSNGFLTLTLPTALSDDVAVKIYKN